MEITDKELEALENVVEYSLDQDEEGDCMEWCQENMGTSNLLLIAPEDRTGHIYWSLLTLQKLINRIKDDNR